MNKRFSSLMPSTEAARSLARLSVSLRLKLLLAALLCMVVCSALLFWIDSRAAAADRLIYQRVERALDATRSAEQAKDAFVQLRRYLVMSATSSATSSEPVDAVQNLQTVIDQYAPVTLAAATALEPIDAGAALRLRGAVTTLTALAMTATRELTAGNTAAGGAHFRQFPVLGAPAESALNNVLARQQQELRLILVAGQASKARAQTQSELLHVLLLSLTALSAAIVLGALFRPLQQLYEALRRIARGQPLEASPLTGNDEFGQLGRALHDLSQLTAQLQTLAYEDPLTGLPNRTKFEQEMTQALAGTAPFAVLFADIDHFRTINDGYGHFFGDQVLKAVATRLQWLIPAGSRLYRYSGDLFAVLVLAGEAAVDESFRARIAADAERLRGRMTEPLLVNGRSLTLCVSLGVGLHPEDGNRTEALISAADAAMYQAKQNGRNVVQFARHDATLNARRRLELADDLRVALKTGAVSPHFQPIVDLGSGSIACAEALARWKHPTRGYVPPDEFIGIAEASGQIDALTEQLLRTACATAVHWQGSRGQPPPKLAFNLSPRQVRHGVVEMIGTVLRETGLPASRLEVEITESAIIERPETAERLLLELKALGVSVALDDFGTGYSSLSYLLRFPIDKIKVDRSFVAQLGGPKQAGKIVAATISLATSLEIMLVAEGVENVGQMVTLYELGCRQQQGWLFSKALPSMDFSQWAQHAPLRIDAIVRAQAEAANEMQPAA